MRVPARGYRERMSLRISEIVIDCADPARAAEFWCSTLGYEVRTSTPDGVEIMGRPSQPTLYFSATDDPKPVKNRLHLDVSPVAGSDRDAEVERLERLGATRADVGQDENVTWVVMHDPVGNEFCVLAGVVPPEPHPFER